MELLTIQCAGYRLSFQPATSGDVNVVRIDEGNNGDQRNPSAIIPKEKLNEVSEFLAGLARA